jgi:chromosome partitioning protein
MKMISTGNHKGGTGKTTTTLSLAHAAALRGYRVLMVDCDPQGQCATALGMRPEPGLFNVLLRPEEDLHQWIRETRRANLELLPGNQDTAAAQIVLGAKNASIEFIWAIFSPLRKEYDFIFFDTAPSVGGIQERVMYAADHVVIPSATEYLSLDGVAQMIDMLGKLRSQHHWKGSLLGVLPTFYDDNTSESRQSMENLKQGFGDDLLSPIHRATVLRECAAEGKTILEFAPASRASQEYEATLTDIIKRI